MKIPSFTRRRSEQEMLSMTPMIDVVFLLLIFFVCASVGQKPLLYFASDSTVAGTGAPIDVEEPPPKLLEKIDVRLYRDGDATLIETNGRTMTEWDEFRAILTELAELAADVPVNFDAADDVPYEDIIAALDVCRECRFESLNFKLPPPKQAVEKKNRPGT